MTFQCRIYKIVNTIDDDLYVGSTRQTIAQRMTVHRADSRKGKKMLVSQHMRELGIANFSIHLLECKEVENRDERLQLETEWQYKLGAKNVKLADGTVRHLPMLNQRPAFISKEEHLEYKRRWAKTHPDLMREMNKRWLANMTPERKVEWKITKASIDRAYADKNRERLQKYWVDYAKEHKPHKREYDMKHREDNKARHAERKKKWRANNITTRRYTCDLCDRAFGSTHELGTHVKNRGKPKGGCAGRDQ